MSVLDIVLPPACSGCGSAGAVLCQPCTGSLRPPTAEGDRFVIVDPGVVVGDALRLGLAAYAYEGPLRRALGELKYRGARRVARELALAGLPFLACLTMIATDAATLVPVPVHAQRERERGYDQAVLLADALGRRLGLAVRRCLRRERPTVKQHRLNRTERLRNLRAAFVAVGPAPRIAILVDDIITTTATLEACADVLREAGTREVYGFAIAREL